MRCMTIFLVSIGARRPTGQPGQGWPVCNPPGPEPPDCQPGSMMTLEVQRVVHHSTWPAKRREKQSSTRCGLLRTLAMDQDPPIGPTARKAPTAPARLQRSTTNAPLRARSLSTAKRSRTRFCRKLHSSTLSGPTRSNCTCSPGKGPPLYRMNLAPTASAYRKQPCVYCSNLRPLAFLEETNCCT